MLQGETRRKVCQNLLNRTMATKTIKYSKKFLRQIRVLKPLNLLEGETESQVGHDLLEQEAKFE